MIEDPSARLPWPDFTAADIDDLLDDLPGGHGVSHAMRRLHEHLLAVRRRHAHVVTKEVVPQQRQAPPHEDDFTHPPAQLVRPAPLRKPRRGLIIRTEDHTGAAGVGVIAEFLQASDGAVAIRRLGGLPQHHAKWELYDGASLTAYEQENSHTGRVEIIYLDPEHDDES